MSRRAHKLGIWGEKIAKNYLLKHGYEILAKNVRNEYGELDIVTRKNDVLVMIEVKTRSNKAFGWPEISIDQRKVNHLIEASQQYLLDHHPADSSWRIDVISIYRPSDDLPPKIHHIENAIN